jgi:Holliday junction resolvase-like predicted endonuclease
MRSNALIKINKSTRHAKITGDFGEALVLYWLSKYGFECARIDHTGIDIIARNPHTQEVMGISVKSRSRTEGTEAEYVSIPNDSFDKVKAACKAFGCVPYFAVVVDAGDKIRAFIVPMPRLLALFPKGKRGTGWYLSPRCLKRYADCPDIMTFEFKTKTRRWWRDKGIMQPPAHLMPVVRSEI